jgi:Tfp pilus assembly protein PilN
MQATILRELEHTSQSGAWLLTLPSQHAYRLRDEQYLLATRNLELPQFQRDPHHAEACTRQTGASVTERHNGLVRVLAELARSVDASVRTNQPPLGEALVAVTDPITGDVSHEVQSSKKRGDLLVVLCAKRYLVDVTVPRATAPSTMTDPAMATAGAAQPLRRRRSACATRHCASIVA